MRVKEGPLLWADTGTGAIAILNLSSVFKYCFVIPGHIDWAMDVILNKKSIK
jgi:hypothetical protein